MVANLFKPTDIQFTLQEINKKSLNTAKGLIGTLKLGDYISDYILGDTIMHKIDNPEQFHILFSET